MCWTKCISHLTSVRISTHTRTQFGKFCIFVICDSQNSAHDFYRAFAKGGKTERALTLYEVARSKKIVLDSYFYAAVIEAAANARLWKLALGLLSEMEAEGIHPTDVIFRCVSWFLRRYFA
jgi:pentatricopeptide repeat protein